MRAAKIKTARHLNSGHLDIMDLRTNPFPELGVDLLHAVRLAAMLLDLLEDLLLAFALALPIAVHADTFAFEGFHGGTVMQVRCFVSYLTLQRGPCSLVRG